MYLNRFATFRRVHAIPRADASEEGGGGRTTGSEQRERERDGCAQGQHSRQGEERKVLLMQPHDREIPR